MDEYVSKVTLAVNGRSITDFKAFTEKGYSVRKKVDLMGKKGVTKVTPDYPLEVDYVVPKTGEVDWDSVEDATLTVEYEGGTVRRYTGVSVMDVGDKHFDGDKETVCTIQLLALKRFKD